MTKYFVGIIDRDFFEERKNLFDSKVLNGSNDFVYKLVSGVCNLNKINVLVLAVKKYCN